MQMTTHRHKTHFEMCNCWSSRPGRKLQTCGMMKSTMMTVAMMMMVTVTMMMMMTVATMMMMGTVTLMMMLVTMMMKTVVRAI